MGTGLVAEGSEVVLGQGTMSHWHWAVGAGQGAGSHAHWVGGLLSDPLSPHHPHIAPQEIEKSAATHFLILFRDGGCQFRALYAAGTEGEGLTRLAGCGPRAVAPTMIEGVYKYSSDRKRFTPIPSRSLSMSVDAFTIQGHFWQGRKPPTPKKPGTPK